MSDIVIRAENLSKLYRIGEREQYGVLRDVLARAASAPFRMFRPRKPQSANGDATHIWALKDVSFEVHQGEVVGIIGRNGAGKSTLLKILSRVTKPTTGYADVRGRMGSLLEVGTGFHPELTGRENTYLNGAILGMSKKEVERKFDEIVTFAGVEKFIDTPIKHYSSGMYLRLAFSVAAHLETEILVIDEVLAVGDLQFQRKCLGKMGQVSREGRTILFVSHNMVAVNALCNRVALIEGGKVQAMGPTQDMIDVYVREQRDRFGSHYDAAAGDLRVGDSSVRLLRARLVNEDFETLDHPLITEKIGVEVTYEILDDKSRPAPNIHMTTSEGQSVLLSIPAVSDFSLGRHTVVVWIPPNTLNDREYVIWVALTTMNPVFIHLLHEVYITVFDDIKAPTRGEFLGRIQGTVRPLLEWQQVE